MPDLIQFWPEQGRYRMVEVKGPGDRLQDNQLRWLEFCSNTACPSRSAMCVGAKRLELQRGSACLVRVQRQGRRPRPALHAVAHRPGRHPGTAGMARRAAGYESEMALEGQFETLGRGAAQTVTTLAATAWKRSRPTVATWPASPPTTASCTGRRPRSTAG
jgi:hypothetical protein